MGEIYFQKNYVIKKYCAISPTLLQPFIFDIVPFYNKTATSTSKMLSEPGTLQKESTVTVTVNNIENNPLIMYRDIQPKNNKVTEQTYLSALHITAYHCF